MVELDWVLLLGTMRFLTTSGLSGDREAFELWRRHFATISGEAA